MEEGEKEDGGVSSGRKSTGKADIFLLGLQYLRYEKEEVHAEYRGFSFITSYQYPFIQLRTS